MLVEHQILVGVFLCVFMRKSLRERLQEGIDCTGIDVKDDLSLVFGSTLRLNKGGAAIRFKLMDSTICFVCSHLAAHRENVAGRNADFHK